MLQDLRYGWRMLRRSPGFTAVVVITLCLGIGLNTAVFSVIRAALLRPLPYRNAERLVWVSDHDGSGKGDFPVRNNAFQKWRKQAKSFESIAAFTGLAQSLTTKDGSEYEQVTPVGGDFWKITGAQPEFGRLFGPAESNVVVLSHDLFEQSFHSDPRIVGKIVSLDGHAVTVTGVLSGNFHFLTPGEGLRGQLPQRAVYVPLPEYEPPIVSSPEPKPPSPTAIVNVVAILKPGVSPGRAEMEIRGLRSHDPSDMPFLPSAQLRVVPYQERLVGNTRPLLLILMAAASLVLLIAVVNVANLLLARATTRQREIGIRVAVGAGRTRVARQFLTESLLLSLLGGIAGLGLAQAAIRLTVHFGAGRIPRLAETRIDTGVLAFAFLISLLAAVLFGFAPILSLWKAQLNDVLKEGARTASVGRRRLQARAFLVAGELALAILLLTGAGLLLKSFWLMNQEPPGFHPERVLTMRVSLLGPRYQANAAKEAFFRTLLQRIETAPGVEAAGFEAGEITMMGPGNPYHDKAGAVKFISTSAGYVRALGIRLIEGRWLTNDEPDNVVLVNETFARTVFPGRDPMGAGVRVFRRAQESTVVGVVSDLKRFALDQDVIPEVYMPYKQFPILPNAYIAVRTSGNDAAAAAGSMRKLISGIDRTAPLRDVMTLEQALADSISPRRFNLFLLGTFAGLALLLALIGIYGVISYSVTQRTQEIGVRMALGAQRKEVIRMVVRQALGITFVGIAAGLITAMGLTRFMAGLLYDVKPQDPAVFVAVALLLAATAVLASWAPALRAALVDPVTALRCE